MSSVKPHRRTCVTILIQVEDQHAVWWELICRVPETQFGPYLEKLFMRAVFYKCNAKKICSKFRKSREMFGCICEMSQSVSGALLRTFGIVFVVSYSKSMTAVSPYKLSRCLSRH